MTDNVLPRGIRNKNPCNLRRTSPPQGWMGAVPPGEATDAEFEQFVDEIFGLRAAGIVLLHSQARKGQCTIRALITSWAPASDHNDTAAYIAAVSDQLGINADAPIALVGPVLEGMLTAIVLHENGRQPYPPAIIAKAAGMARRAAGPA